MIISGSPSAFQFIPKVLNEVEVRALCRPHMVHSKLGKPFILELGFVRVGLVVLKQERALCKTVAAKFEACCCLKYHGMLQHSELRDRKLRAQAKTTRHGPKAKLWRGVPV